MGKNQLDLFKNKPAADKTPGLHRKEETEEEKKLVGQIEIKQLILEGFVKAEKENREVARDIKRVKEEIAKLMNKLNSLRKRLERRDISSQMELRKLLDLKKQNKG